MSFQSYCFIHGFEFMNLFVACLPCTTPMFVGEPGEFTRYMIYIYIYYEQVNECKPCIFLTTTDFIEFTLSQSVMLSACLYHVLVCSFSLPLALTYMHPDIPLIFRVLSILCNLCVDASTVHIMSRLSWLGEIWIRYLGYGDITWDTVVCTAFFLI